jgi:thioredoxin 1
MQINQEKSMNVPAQRAMSRVLLVVAFAWVNQASSVRAQNAIPFAPLEQWKSAVVSGDPVAVKSLYGPAARIDTPAGDVNADADAAFWTALKVRSLKLDVQQSDSPQAGLQQVVFQAEVRSAISPAPVYISEAQVWQQQQGLWRMVKAQRSNPARLQQPLSIKKEIYAENSDAHAEVEQALQKAAAEHKRVLLVFGANWCYDCHVLDLAFHRADLAPILARGFEVVHVDVGRGDKNQDLMNHYQVPMKKGIPGLAVVASDGKLLFSQQNGEFENARSLGPQDLMQFLDKWKPEPK